MSTATPARLLSAEEYRQLDGPDCPTELVRGEIIEMNQPGFRHGRICGRIYRFIDEFAETNDIGQATSNDSGVITERDPDTVRGPDVAYFSYDRIPKGDDPEGYPDAVPELAFEVLSPTDQWSDLLAKVGEFIAAGVNYVVIVDPATVTIQVYSADDCIAKPDGHDEFNLPDVLPGFAMRVERMVRR